MLEEKVVTIDDSTVATLIGLMCQVPPSVNHGQRFICSFWYDDVDPIIIESLSLGGGGEQGCHLAVTP